MSDEISISALDEAIADIMLAYGPDGHTDGSVVIAVFVKELLEGKSIAEAQRLIYKIYEEE